MLLKFYHLPGIIIGTTPSRAYRDEINAAHILGYLREISRTELTSARYSTYRPGVMIGKSGVEKVLESSLHGHSGRSRVEINALGTRIAEQSITNAITGHNVYLSLDLNTQTAAEESLAQSARCRSSSRSKLRSYSCTGFQARL